MKHKKIIKYFLFMIIFIFLCSYIIEMSGYYEYNLNNKKNLTEEEMRQFEEDVRSGKEIDLNSYLKDSSIDYSNSLSRTTSDVSLKLNDYLKEFLTNGLKVFKKLVM